MGTLRELTGTAVAPPNDAAAQLQAYELAQLRLHQSAEKLGVFIGPATFNEPVHARGRGGGHLIIVVTAPVLDTGTDEKVDHGPAERDVETDR